MHLVDMLSNSQEVQGARQGGQGAQAVGLSQQNEPTPLAEPWLK